MSTPSIPVDLEDIHGSRTGTGQVSDQLAALERRLAIAMARADLESYAAQVETPKGQMPRYDAACLNPLQARYMDQDDMERSVARAVQYLDLIGGLDRVEPGSPTIVSIKRALHELDQLEGGAA